MNLPGLPGLAQVAIQSRQHAAKTIVRRLNGDSTPRPFRYRDKGTMATVARFQAIVSAGRLSVSGLPGWVMWLAVHLVAIAGYKNRISTLSNWTISFLSRKRPQRAITTQQVFARHTHEHQTSLITKGASAFTHNGTSTPQPRDELPGPTHGLQC